METDETPGEEVLDTGDGGEETTVTTEETPGAPAGGGNTTTTPPGRLNPAPPAPRFTQDQVNRFIADERRKWDLAASRRAAAPASPDGRVTPREFDAETTARLNAILDERLAPVKEIQAKTEINDAFSNFGELHPEFLKKETRDAVVNAILELGEDAVQKTSMSVLLEYGWLKTQWGAFDKEAFRKQAIADHLAGKGAQARTTGQPQGAGGKATTTPKPRGKEWKDTDAAMKQLIDEEKAAL